MGLVLRRRAGYGKMIQVPRRETLRKYGLTEEDYRELYALQGGICPICLRPLDKRINIDHFHQKGWKKMLPERRKLFVRGLVHWVCNHYYLGRGITVERAKNVVNYLERFENRRPK
jgi:hypothetical protein